MLKTSLPSIKISAASTNEIVTRFYKRNVHNFMRSRKMKAFVWRNVTMNGTMIVYTILEFTIERL